MKYQKMYFYGQQWEKIFNDDELEDIQNQQWYEIDLHDLYLDNERIEWYDLEINLD